MVTGEQDGQVGHADAPASCGAGIGTLGAPVEPACAGTGRPGTDVPGAGTTGAGALGEPVEPACAGTGTTGVDGAGGDTETGGPTKKVAEAPAWLGLGVCTMGTGTTVGVLCAGQFLTVGAQLVRITSTVLKAVASTTGAETCSWT